MSLMSLLFILLVNYESLIQIPWFSVLVTTSFCTISNWIFICYFSCVLQWWTPNGPTSRNTNSQFLLCLWHGIYEVLLIVFCYLDLHINADLWLYDWNLLGWCSYSSHGRGKHWSNQHWEPRLYYITSGAYVNWFFCEVLVWIDYTLFFQVSLLWLNLLRMWRRSVMNHFNSFGVLHASLYLSIVIFLLPF